MDSNMNSSLVSAASKKTTIANNSEAYYKHHFEQMQKENKELKQQLDLVERQNRDLKKSIYELSMRQFTGISASSSTNSSSFSANLPARPSNPSSNFNAPRDFFQLDSIMSDISAELVREHSHSSIHSSFKESRETGNFRKDARSFYHKFELKGHNGAVYCVDFSPCGKMLGSGSFDKTVRVWDTQLQRELFCFDKHKSNVSDVCWSYDSRELISASFDQTVKIWDIECSKLISSYSLHGFVQSVKFHPVDPNLFFLGTTRNHLIMFDRRSPERPSHQVENNSMVNALYVYRDGSHVLTGDSKGYLKTWDLRTESCLDETLNDDFSSPVSDLVVPRGRSDCEEEERYLSVNSYDNVLRVYDRGSMPPKTKLHSLYQFKGHKNKNWPIRSSFYCGPEHINRTLRNPTVDDGIDSLESPTREGRQRSDTNDETEQPSSIASSLLVATGSADYKTYIYDVGPFSSPLVQALEGHTDRVYAVDFHPVDPILATCSADATIKIWTAKSKRM